MSTPENIPARASNHVPLLREPCDDAPYMPGNMNATDFSMFNRCGISERTLDLAKVERLTNEQAKDRLAIQRSGDFAGIYFPYVDPCDGRRTGARLRRDHPEIEGGKPQNKYYGEQQSRPHVFYPPGVGPRLKDKLYPVVIVESEKAALALSEWSARQNWPLLPIATGGKDGWRGKIGKAPTADGETVDEKGPAPNLDLIDWVERDSYILFDSNTRTNPLVRWSRARLTRELESRGARVKLPNLPQQDQLNGPDDAIALLGDAVLLRVFESAPTAAESARLDATNVTAKLETQIESVTADQAKELYEALAAVDDRDDRDRLINSAATVTRGTLTKREIKTGCSRCRTQLLQDRAEGWRKALLISETGTPKPLLANVQLVLHNDPKYQNLVAFDEFSGDTVLRRSASWLPCSAVGSPWNDICDSFLTAELQKDYGLALQTRIAAEGLTTIAHERSFHAVRDYLRSCVWDNVPRLASWLAVYLGTVATPYTAAVGRCWLISGVARAMVPGDKADSVLGLIGPQGILKSTALEVLASEPWFTDHISPLGEKDSRLDLQGTWIVELAELDRVRGADLARVKNFLSTKSDKFRVPYGHRKQPFPRSCIFASTSNISDMLTDETGNRRWWPVECGHINIEALRRDRDLLWAEALHRYKAGEHWWLDSAELVEAAAEETEKHYESGSYDELILPWLENPQPRDYNIHIDRIYETEQGSRILRFDSSPALSASHCRIAEPVRVTILDILVHCLGRGSGDIDPKVHRAVRTCLTHAGWKTVKPEKVGPGSQRTARFYRKESQ